jgi:hypothetical protein
MMRHFVLLLFSFFFLAELTAQSGNKKNGTITIQKEKQTLSGLYQKTKVYTNMTIPQAAGITNSRPDKQFSEFYFYFLPNGILYQIESNESESSILELAKDSPEKLRPVLASYSLLDSILIITPLQESVTKDLEPTKAYFEGVISGDQLFVTKRNIMNVTVFRRIQEE